MHTTGMPETNSVPERTKQPATRFLKDVKVTLKKDIVEPVDLRSYEPVATEHGIGIILKSQSTFKEMDLITYFRNLPKFT